MAAGVSAASEAPRRADARQASGQVVVEDITIAVPGQDPVQAWLVRPGGQLKKNSAPGVLWLHWLGEINNDRSEYLSEAVTLAGEGVVSVLPQGYFPWVPNPDGTTGDVTLVENQVAALRPPSTDWPASGRSTSRDRAGRPRLRRHVRRAARRLRRPDLGMVLQAPDALMGNWFAQFWLGSRAPSATPTWPSSTASTRSTTPPGSATACSSSGRRGLLHRPGRPRRLRRLQPGRPGEALPDEDHEFRDDARVDRLAFLREQLGGSLVEEGALAPVTKPGEMSAHRYRGFVTGLTALLNQRRDHHNSSSCQAKHSADSSRSRSTPGRRVSMRAASSGNRSVWR